MTKVAGTSGFTFAATSGTKTITTAAVVFDNPFAFNGVGGTFQLQDALTSGAARTLTLTNGTLDLNNYTLTIGYFSSTNSNIRTLAFGTGKLVVTGNNGAVVNVDTATNFSFTGSGNIEGTYSGSVASRFFNIGNTAGGSQARAMNLKVTAGTDIVNVYQYWNDVDFTGFAGTFGNAGNKIYYGSLTLSTGLTMQAATTATFTFAATSSKTITSNGKTIDYPITFNGINGTWACQDALTLGSTRALTFTNGTLQLKSGATSTVGSFVTSGTTQKFLQSTISGTQATISQALGVVSTNNLTIKDINAIGGATWDAFYYNDNIDNGNNTNWIFGESPVYGAEYEYKLRSFTEPRRF
jgi:hypothetical protein